MSRWFYRSVAATVLLSASALGRAADNVQFDVPTILACREVTTAEFVRQNPSQRLWEARLSVSVLSKPVVSGRVAQLLVRIDNPRRTLQVVDYAPHTTLATDVQGSIRREHHAESTRSFDFRIKGGVPGLGEGEATGSSRDRSTTDEHVERLPPLSLCVASGATQRGSGVYFKLQPTSRSTLEGNHEFIVWLAAPENWAGDAWRIRCEAYGRAPTLVSSRDELVAWGEQAFVAALFRAGDELGRDSAEELVRAEGELRWALARHRQTLASRRGNDLVGDLTSLWSGRDNRLPDGWFEQLVYGGASLTPTTSQRLPPAVRDAAERYVAARQNLTTAQLERLPPVR